jgi:hypothetical protein
MTPAEFSAALEALGWSHRHLARRLRCDSGLPIRWARGTAPVPLPLARWLVSAWDWHELHPPPVDWRVWRVVPNVRDFGAVGDGVTDDTAAFQAAVNAAATRKTRVAPRRKRWPPE